MSTRKLVLELACRNDASAIALMSREFIEAGLGWAYRPGTVGRLIDNPEAVALVGRENGHLTGFAIMTFGDDHAHLVLLAVRPEARRRGIARRMIQWLAESAVAGGIASIHVELRARNAPAIALYRASGFAETLRVPGYYRGVETAVRMMRMLRAPCGAPPKWQPPSRKPY